MKIDIIGAGIGGLTTALALEQKGYEVNIFEQSTEIKPVGAGIMLAHNAMQVFGKLGLKEEIEQAGNRVRSINIAKSSMQILSKVDLGYFDKKYGVENIAIHRGSLQELLLKKLKNTTLKLNHTFDSVEKKGNGHTINFTNGTKHHSSVLLAVDGLHSKVREQLFSGNTIRDAEQVCWRGISDFKIEDKYCNQLYELWGKKSRFGFVKIAENKVYWFALRNTVPQDDVSVSQISELFLTFHPLVQQIISATAIDKIHTAFIQDLEPTEEWYQGNICLMGDAVHATTPNMGQGACQAIEDAYVMAECLHKHHNEVNRAFEEFKRIRLEKAHQVVKSSWTVGKMAHTTNPFLRGLRNGMLKMIPASFGRSQSDKIFQLEKVL